MILYHYKEMVSWILSITATGSVGESTIATEKSQIRVDVYTVSSWKRGYFTCQKKGPLWNIAAEFWMLEFKHLGSRGVTMGAEVKIVKPRSCNHPYLDEFHRDVHMSHWNHSFSAKSSQDCIASVSWRLVKYSNNQVSEIKRTLSCRHWLPSRSCEVADLKQTTFSPELEQTGNHFKAKLDSNTSPGLDMNIQTYDIFEQFSSLFVGFARGDFFWRKQLWFHYQVHLESKIFSFWKLWGRERQEGVDKVDEATLPHVFFSFGPFGSLEIQPVFFFLVAPGTRREGSQRLVAAIEEPRWLGWRKVRIGEPWELMGRITWDTPTTKHQTFFSPLKMGRKWPKPQFGKENCSVSFREGNFLWLKCQL